MKKNYSFSKRQYDETIKWFINWLCENRCYTAFKNEVKRHHDAELHEYFKWLPDLVQEFRNLPKLEYVTLTDCRRLMLYLGIGDPENLLRPRMWDILLNRYIKAVMAVEKE